MHLLVLQSDSEMPLGMASLLTAPLVAGEAVDSFASVRITFVCLLTMMTVRCSYKGNSDLPYWVASKPLYCFI